MANSAQQTNRNELFSAYISGDAERRLNCRLLCRTFRAPKCSAHATILSSRRASRLPQASASASAKRTHAPCTDQQDADDDLSLSSDAAAKNQNTNIPSHARAPISAISLSSQANVRRVRETQREITGRIKLQLQRRFGNRFLFCSFDFVCFFCSFHFCIIF